MSCCNDFLLDHWHQVRVKMSTYAMMGISKSLQVFTMPFFKAYVHRNDSSISIATILVMFEVSRIVLALTSLRATPPIFPSFTSSAKAGIASFNGTDGSLLAGSNMSIFPLSPSIFKQFLTLSLMYAALPSGFKPGLVPSLTLRTTLSTSSGSFQKYLLKKKFK